MAGTAQAADRVLLISADTLLVLAYRARLEQEGFEVDAIASGRMALDRAEEWLPACLVLDAQLPGMHGLEVLKWMPDVPSIIKIPVVLVTERTLPPTVLEECSFWGARRVVRKDTIPPVDIAAVIRDVLSPHPAPSA